MTRVGLRILGPSALALLATAGQVKGNPLLAWLPVDLTVLAASVVLLMCVASRAISGPAVGYVAIPIVIWVLFLPPIALSNFDDYALTKIATLFTISAVLAIAPFYLLRDHSQRVIFLLAITAIAVLISITALFISPASANDYNDRLVFDGSNTIGTGRAALVGTVVLVLFVFLNKLKARRQVVLLAGALLTAALGVMTGSVGPVMAALCTILVAMVFSPSFAGQRARAIVGLIIISVSTVWVTYVWNPDGIERIINTVSGEASTSTSARVQLWEESFERIGSSPLGQGWGMYSAPYLQHRYPHNLLLEVGVEAGWLPMLILFLLMVVTLIRGARLATEPVMTAFWGLYLFSVLNSMVSGDVNGTRLIWIAMFAIWTVPLFQHDGVQDDSNLTTKSGPPRSVAV